MPKKRLDEQRAEAASREHRPRPQLYLLLENIRSLHNVGAVFRAADGFGVRKIFLTGITPRPPREEISKIALGAEESVDWEWMEDPLRAAVILREMGVPLLAVEQTHESGSIYEVEFPHPLALAFGHEQIGLEERLLGFATAAVEIPMFGAKHSHNVATAAGIVLSEVRRQWSARSPLDPGQPARPRL